MAEPMVSFIVPTLNESRALPHLFRGIAACGVAHEIVVADGGSVDGTASVAETAGARVIRTARGRGTQLARGVEASRGRLLCFLHADVRLGADALARIAHLSERHREDVAYVFRLRIDGHARWYRGIESGTNLRTRWLGLPYGDQGLILSRALYVRVGGYPEIPLMEDVAIVRVIRKVARIGLLPEQVTVSARRWERDGAVRRTARNWGLLAAYLAGADPARLAERYRPPAPAPARGGRE